MKSGTQVALAVGAGYLLGRRRKMRMALMLGGAAMAGGLGGMPGQLVRRGAGLLGSADVLGKLAPGLGEVTGMISEELLPVGKAAARAAVSSQVNALSDRVHERAEVLRHAQEAGEQEEVPSGRRRRGRRFEGDGEYGDEDEYGAGDENEEAPPSRTARSRRGPAGTARRAGGDGQRHDRRRQDREDGDGEDEDVPVRAAGSRAGAPVRRTRR